MMQEATITGRSHRRPATHLRVEQSMPAGRIRISCADPGCAAWDPWPCESRREAQFWYDLHISRPLIHHL
jgi:hypothetical protein